MQELRESVFSMHQSLKIRRESLEAMKRRIKSTDKVSGGSHHQLDESMVQN